jgi:uroporphyrinogen-III synthase
MDGSALAGLLVVTFEARRARELGTMLARHGAEVLSAPALRETPLGATPEALELARRLPAGEVDAVILLTGVGTRALAAAVTPACPRFAELLSATRVIARGPKPLAALRELGVSGALAVGDPFTWRQVIEVLDRLGLRAGQRVAVQEYGVPPAALLDALAERGLHVLRVPVYRWALPDDPGPLHAAGARLLRGEVGVSVFTNAAQAEHLFRIAPDADALRAALRRTVIASIGPTCSEALEAHAIPPDLEASPPKMGPLVALIAENAKRVLGTKRK